MRDRSAPKTRAGPKPPLVFQPPLTVTHPALLVGGSDRHFREFLDNLLHLTEQVQRLRSTLAAELGVTAPQYRLMWIVAQLQGDRGVSVVRVARRMRVTGAFVTNEVGKLCVKGFVVKRDDPQDRRSVLLQLAPAGEQALNRLAAAAQQINDDYFFDLSMKEFNELSRIVAKLVANGERTLQMAQAWREIRPESDHQLLRPRQPRRNAIERSRRNVSQLRSTLLEK
jgi:MarR family transcriptional regulator, organic hydroperoxide resistance regulator